MARKNFIITGATGNLGAAVVDKLLREKNAVAALISHGKKLPLKKNLSTYQADLIKEIEATSAVEKIINDHGHVQGAVLTVGGFASGSIESTPIGDIQKMIELNFNTTYNVIRPLLKHFKNQKEGRLVLIGARPALEPQGGKTSAGYALSKTLIFKLAELINVDTSGMDIKTSVVVPNIIDTPANREAMPKANFKEWLAPDAIANVIWDFINDIRSEGIIKLY
jgi:NAD(P)-dependent dehydrogenase (short-subunit alcohol dehydrogenase family)